ncbi:MAG: GTP pyrophosphokinase family protein [Lachnospiraceae bacterium]|jgi:putative GTP pyrophosphokinase|nr:GTP pyrophosphokinase family protein [Lachnospiraceae bacterium]MEE3460536.1 GTP pyrophosphokinase family protein [Lachnospiraceae bacterium]
MEIQLWREILAPYREAVNELIVKFNHIKEEYNTRGMYSPIEQVTGRVKKISSIMDKAKRKNVPLDELEGHIEDIAGIRIICQFAEDINTVVDIIRKRSDMEIKKEKDYITSPKQSGYRSYHIIVKYTIQTLNGPKRLDVEIQIRTLAMNFWSTIEHSLQYKYKGNMPDELRERLLRAAQAVGQLDDVMASVRYEIMDAQNVNRAKSEVVSDILNNIENLYMVANKREVVKIQDEFIQVFNRNDMDLLMRFNKQLDILAENYRAQSVNDM